MLCFVRGEFQRTDSEWLVLELVQRIASADSCDTGGDGSRAASTVKVSHKSQPGRRNKKLGVSVLAKQGYELICVCHFPTKPVIPSSPSYLMDGIAAVSHRSRASDRRLQDRIWIFVSATPLDTFKESFQTCLCRQNRVLRARTRCLPNPNQVVGVP